MKEETEAATKDATKATVESVSWVGGHLRCEVCDTTRELGDVQYKFLNGWPKHCGYSMRWRTQREIDAAAASGAVSERP